jgi:quercetin dioxygenase-like cupin family protein
MPVQTESAYALMPYEGKRLAWFTSTVVQKASTPAIGITEIVIAAHEEPPPHIHTREDEFIYVLEGEVGFRIGERQYRGGPGTFVSFPRGIAHGFEIHGPAARLLIINTPGGFERMFELAPATPEDAVAAMAEFGMELVDR